MKKKKRRKIWYKKRIVLFCIILFFSFFWFVYSNFSTSQISSYVENTPYPIITQDTNSNYAGVGQEKAKHKDGYFTTFKTTNQMVYKEYKQNGNSSWSNLSYWDNTMATDGCGITALSIILSGYGKNITPEDLRERYYPVLRGDNISHELTYTFGIANSDFFYDSTHLSTSYIEDYLKTNKPILICVWNKPTNNRWTTASHYMVLLATDGHGMVYVSNPNGLENTSKSSGWYPISEITPYLAKALFVEEE